MYLTVMLQALLTDYYKNKKQKEKVEIINPVKNITQDLPDNMGILFINKESTSCKYFEQIKLVPEVYLNCEIIEFWSELYKGRTCVMVKI